MPDPKVLDLMRELRKARVALCAAQNHLAANATAHAALHCATEVKHTPLHGVITIEIAQIDHTLARTEAWLGKAPTRESRRTTGRLAGILLDLDRCEHGRHSVENCLGCDGGQSTGNLLLPPGKVIGHGHKGAPIVVPEFEDRDDWTAWRPAPSGGEG